MIGKSVSLVLLGGVFAIGALTSDGPAVLAGSPLWSAIATLAIIVLLAIGVFSWHRIVKSAHEARQEQKIGESTTAQPDVPQSTPKHLLLKRG